MSKRNLIIGIIVLIVLVGGVVLWSQKNNQQKIKQQTKKEVAKQDQEQKIAKEQNSQDQNQKQEVNKEQEENQEQDIKHLSPEEIEKLKKEKDLVWYEIPELGIKFLVTKDTKRDLKYHFTVNEKYKSSSSVVLYSNGGINYGKYEDGCILHEGGWTCGRILLTSATKEYAKQYKKRYNRDFCTNNNDNKPEGVWIFIDKDKMICFKYTHANIKTVITDSFYKEKFYKKSSNKTFGIYLNAIQPIK